MLELIFKIIGFIFIACIIGIGLWKLILLVIAFFASGIWLWLIAIAAGLGLLGFIFSLFDK